MADLRETLLANAKTALSAASVTANSEATTKPTGLNVYRHRTRRLDLSKLPDVAVFFMGERPARRLEDGTTGISERRVEVGVLCRAKATTSQTGDEALIPVLQWAEIALLLADYTLSGAAVNAEEVQIDALDVEEHADTVAAALVRIPFIVDTKLWDPRQAP